MKSFGRIAVMLVALGVLAAAAGVFLVKSHLAAAGPLQAAHVVVIPKGAGLSAIASHLKADGVIVDANLFTIGVRLFGDAKSLKAGEYAFAPRMSPKDVMDMIAAGRTVAHAITIPEGRTVRQIVDLVMADPILVGTVAKTYEEGSLLPETYHFSRGETRQALLDRMAADMTRVLSALWQERDMGLPLTTMNEALILASVVERETGLAAERPKVAAVFLNRLRLGMRLQSDPTVIYPLSDGLGVMERPLTFKDLETPSEYNTYLHAGLPIGPISNPGKASLDAVMHPLASDALYFVADGSGGHVFAKSLEAHNANVAKWRLVQKAKRQDASSAAPVRMP